MRPFFENNVLQQQPFKPMIIVVDTTKAGSASNTFVLPIIKDTTETVKIYWGDGTNSIGANGNNTHVYAASGIYTIKIESRLFGGIYFNNLGDKAKITKIANYGQGVSRLNIGSFYGCSSLLSIDIGNIVSNGTNAYAMFSQCTALTTVPLLNLSSVTNAYAMFAYCAALTTVPLLNLSSVTNAINMFSGVTLTTQSYSDFLINLATLPLQSGVSFHGGNSKYNPTAAIARAYLISNFGWTITDGGAA